MTAHIKMKELEARTGVSRETIRYYIREGLLAEPEKPKPNVALYDETHIERLALIKKLQHERFLPLGVIKDMLDGDGAALKAEKLPSFLGLEFLLSARFGDEGSRQPLALSEVAERANLALKDIEEMDRAGLITIAVGGTLSKQDADIIELWGRIQNAGFRNGEGFGMEALKRFADAADSLAAADVENFYDSMAGKMSTEEATSLAEQGIVLSNELLGRLRLRAIIREVAEHNARAMEDAAGE